MNIGRNTILFAASAIFIVSLTYQIRSQRPMDIDGSLVDANDNPVKNGKMTVLYDPQLPATSFEQLVFSTTPIDNGLFGFAVNWYSDRKLMVLMEDRPEGFYPISNPAVLTNERIFKGVIISKYKRERNVGKIRSYVKYGRLVLDVRKCSASFTDKILTQELFVKVSSPDGFVVANTTFKPAYYEQSKQVILNLPEGTWYLEFVDESSTNSKRPPLIVTISPYEATEVDGVMSN